MNLHRISSVLFTLVLIALTSAKAGGTVSLAKLAKVSDAGAAALRSNSKLMLSKTIK